MEDPIDTMTPEELTGQAEQTEQAQQTEQLSAPKKKQTKKPIGLIAALIAAAVVIVGIAICLAVGARKEAPNLVASDPTSQSTGLVIEESEGGEEQEPEKEAAVRADPSYYREEEDFRDAALLDQVVAVCGDCTLTNRGLAYYYWQEFYLLMNNYSQYISYLLDPYARLDEQYLDDTESWDQYLMDSCMKTYAGVAAIYNLAKADGYVLPAEDQAVLDSFESDLEGYAKEYGYSSAEEYLRGNFGPYCTVSDYRGFVTEYLTASSYLTSYALSFSPTEAELDAFYESGRTAYEEAGVKKDGSPAQIDVRHILIMPETPTVGKDDPGYAAAAAAADDAAKAEAERIYQLYLAGEKTEAAFGELAKTYSADGSASSGGLYEGITPGRTVTEFNDWCFLPERKSGDTGIVKTQYGYHIMFFVGAGEETYWHQVITADYLSSKQRALRENAAAEFPVQVDLTKAAVYPCNIALG